MNPWRDGRLGVALVAASVAVFACTSATAQVITAPPNRPLPTVATTAPPTTTPPPTAPPTTAPPPTTSSPTTAPASTEAPTSTAAPSTTTSTTKVATVTTLGPTTTTTSTSTAPKAALAGPPPPSLSNSSVSSILSGLARNGAGNSTNALLDALRPLQDVGLSRDQAIAIGFGRFPVGGEAYFRDDFGEPRDSPEAHSHQGNDIFAAFGTPVRAPANGVVTFSNEPVGGKCAYVTEADGTWYSMAHLRGFAPGVAEGSTVKAGDVIGFNGDTGNAQGGAPHVHFEVHPRGGAAVSPKPYLDAWLADALAAVPDLLAPYRSDPPTGPFTAIGLARHLDLGILAGMPRGVDPGPAPSAFEVAEALVGPLTPAGLRGD